MAQPDRRPESIIISVYGALALGVARVAHWVVPPLLLSEHPGPVLAAVKRFIAGVPAPFLAPGLIVHWREYAVAVLIGMVLHLSIVLVVRRNDANAGEPGDPSDARAKQCLNIVLIFLSFAFLTVTIISGACHDYYLTSRCGTRSARDMTPGSSCSARTEWCR